MNKLLVIEDDINLNEGIAMTLADSQTRVLRAKNLAEAEQKLKEERPDLILLDVNLPDGSGFDFCKKLREESDIPIIFLTANDMELDIVRGLEMGGDDYITKPFSLMVLRARVNSVLRRRQSERQAAGRAAEKRELVLAIDDLLLDFENMAFMREGEAVSLSKTEQKLLKILVVNRGQTLSKERLLDKVWETEFVDEHALPVTIKRLRDKLKTSRIKSIYGIGYTWEKESR